MADPVQGEIRMFGGTFAPVGWALCQGQLLSIAENTALFNLLGTTYGGDGQTTFGLPDLRGRVPMHRSNDYPVGQQAGTETETLVTGELPVHTHIAQAFEGAGTGTDPTNQVWANSITPLYSQANPDSLMNPTAVGQVGGGQPHDNMLPFLAINFIICLSGDYPSQNGGRTGDPFIGDLQIFAFPFAPSGWAFCDGQLLSIAQNSALFSLLKTVYGGDGQTNFALPDLRGRTPVHQGDYENISFVLGSNGGEAGHTLIIQEMPGHNHPLAANSNTVDQPSPVNNFWGNPGETDYAATPTVIMSQAAIAAVGQSQPHNNLSPYLVLNLCIALQGVYPSHN